jgi:hypothetical protein
MSHEYVSNHPVYHLFFGSDKKPQPTTPMQNKSSGVL